MVSEWSSTVTPEEWKKYKSYRDLIIIELATEGFLSAVKKEFNRMTGGKRGMGQ